MGLGLLSATPSLPSMPVLWLVLAFRCAVSDGQEEERCRDTLLFAVSFLTWGEALLGGPPLSHHPRLGHVSTSGRGPISKSGIGGWGRNPLFL